MLKKLADRNMQDTMATDYYGQAKYFKLLNISYLGMRRLHTDQQGVCSMDSGIVAGTILKIEGGQVLVVSVATIDYYRGIAIRKTMDLIDCNNEVTVSRPQVVTNSQGRVIGQTAIQIHASVPVKIGTVLQRIVTELDDTYSQFGMLLSTKFPVQKGDILTFKKHYEPAKVEGIKLNLDGVFEVAFDEDPRWIIRSLITAPQLTVQPIISVGV